jgi:SAM-dependent methyltransferase
MNPHLPHQAKSMARRIYKRAFGTWMSEYQRALRQSCVGCRTLLDVGCGEDSPLAGAARRMERSVGLDAFEPAISASRARKIHDDYVLGDVRKLGDLFEPASFDCVAAIDLIEHLDKAEGEALLEAMERIARRRVVVFTPNGFLPQEPYGDNEFQRHRSGWEPDEMRARGYRVVGINGWKPLRGERALVRSPRWVWEPVSFLSQPLVAPRPRHAFQILCVKYL